MKFSPRWGVVNVTLGRPPLSILPPARPDAPESVRANDVSVDSDESRSTEDRLIPEKRSTTRFSKDLVRNERWPVARKPACLGPTRTRSGTSRPEPDSATSSQSAMLVRGNRRLNASRAYLIANVPLVLAVFLLPHLHVYLWGLLGVGSAGAIVVGVVRCRPNPATRVCMRLEVGRSAS
jgi:hypothetical protein